LNLNLFFDSSFFSSSLSLESDDEEDELLLLSEELLLLSDEDELSELEDYSDSDEFSADLPFSIFIKAFHASSASFTYSGENNLTSYSTNY